MSRELFTRCIGDMNAAGFVSDVSSDMNAAGFVSDLSSDMNAAGFVSDVSFDMFFSLIRLMRSIVTSIFLYACESWISQQSSREEYKSWE